MKLPVKSKMEMAAIAALVVALVVMGPSTRPGAGQEETAGPEERHLIRSLEGEALFAAYCAVCHGIDGKGGGPAASALKKAVPDLTRISQRNAGNFPSVRVQTIISGEEIATPAHGSREMPIWGPIFGQIAWDQDLGKVRIYNLAKYLESLQQK
jgi:mono/diheme cytochrome c family protein